MSAGSRQSFRAASFCQIILTTCILIVAESDLQNPIPQAPGLDCAKVNTTALDSASRCQPRKVWKGILTTVSVAASIYFDVNNSPWKGAWLALTNLHNLIRLQIRLALTKNPGEVRVAWNTIHSGWNSIYYWIANTLYQICHIGSLAELPMMLRILKPVNFLLSTFNLLIVLGQVRPVLGQILCLLIEHFKGHKACFIRIVHRYWKLVFAAVITMYTSGWYQTMRSQTQIPWSPLLLTSPSWQTVLSLVAMGYRSWASEGKQLLDLQELMPSLSIGGGSCTLTRACIHQIFSFLTFLCDAAKRLLWAASNQRQFWTSKSTFCNFV